MLLFASLLATARARANMGARFSGAVDRQSPKPAAEVQELIRQGRNAEAAGRFYSRYLGVHYCGLQFQPAVFFHGRIALAAAVHIEKRSRDGNS